MYFLFRLLGNGRCGLFFQGREFSGFKAHQLACVLMVNMHFGMWLLGFLLLDLAGFLLLGDLISRFWDDVQRRGSFLIPQLKQGLTLNGGFDFHCLLVGQVRQ